jgi:dienelactone hydrolase
MTRREIFELLGKSVLAGGLAKLPAAVATGTRDGKAFENPPPTRVAGTQPFSLQGDAAAQMVEGLHQYLLRLTAASVEARASRWNQDYSSHAAYEASVEPNRKRFRQIIGLIDERVPYSAPHVEFPLGNSSVAARGAGYKVSSVRWPALEGVDAEGLLLEPDGVPRAQVVALPDADWTPEMLAGLAPGIPAQAQFARRLAENGCLVMVPTLISRGDEWSGNARLGKSTNLTHREFIYRMAYEIGRHIIGYEVQKVRAAVDWLTACQPSRPVGVMGYGEGGLLALYSAAADTRIQAACVSGYFQPREGLWEEPIYRNVWRLLQEFGDAELAALVAPRTLVVEASRGVEISGPPPATNGRSDSAASGGLASPPAAEVQREVQRAQPVFVQLGAADHLALVLSDDGQGEPGSDNALRVFLRSMGATGALKPPGPGPRDFCVGFDPAARHHHQFQQLCEFTQRVVMECEAVRKDFWEKADASSVESWKQSTPYYRRYLWEEIIGKLPPPSLPLEAQSRTIYDEAKWTGYEVMLPLWPNVFAYGILLLPKALIPGERRPVVVCQHGLEGRPQDLIKSDAVGEGYYHHFAARLADQGFIVYCPQNPYLGGDKFRKLLRLAHPLQLTLFSFILSQHERTLDWLCTLDCVDAARIGFYGLSYGGKTAVRVPPLLERYALSICSGDFNEWIWKVSRDDTSFSYVFSPEYDMLEFNLGNTYNYSEMANLMAPRPFMVERGHDDGVSVDSWVAYEYAKVRRHYDRLGLSDRTRIEFFNGPHTIHGVGTFEFLHKFLNWGEP